jgi:hypothetical protein
LIQTSSIRRAENIAPAFDALKGRADALYVCTDPLVNTHRIRVHDGRQTCGMPACAWRIAAAFGEKVFAIPFHPFGRKIKLPATITALTGAAFSALRSA